MTIKEEFEIAFAAEYPDFYYATREISHPAIWAANWMNEKCAMMLESTEVADEYHMADKVRQLAIPTREV